MKVIIAGSRRFTIENHLLHEIIRVSNFDVDYIISGGARGVDSCAITYAKDFRIPYQVVRPQYQRYGRVAAPIRNGEMIKIGEALIAIYFEEITPGTADIIRKATKYGLPVFKYDLKTKTGEHVVRFEQETLL